MILGEFDRRLKEALCHLKQMEQFTLWQSATRKIEDLKKCSTRKLIKFDAPKSLWDDCLEEESYIRFITAHSIYLRQLCLDSYPT